MREGLKGLSEFSSLESRRKAPKPGLGLFCPFG